MIKRAVNMAFETTLTEGVRAERALFHSLLGTPHQREGMAAFLEKRRPDFAPRGFARTSTPRYPQALTPTKAGP